MATEIPASTTRPYPPFFPDPFHHTLAELLEPEQRASMYPAPQPTLAGVLRGSGFERTPSVPAPLRERPMLAVAPHAWSETDGRGLEVAFRAKVGKRYQLRHKGIIPEEFGVIARYRGQGRLSEPGFENPRWVDGELVILDGKYIKSGQVVGFVYWAPEY